MPTSNSSLLYPSHLGLARASSLASFVVSLLVLVAPGCGAVPRVDVTPEGPLVTSESGQSVALSITLAQRPLGPIEVYAVVSNGAEASASAAVRLDAQSWKRPQVIRVTGVDDDVGDGEAAYDVAVYARATGTPGAEPQLVTTLHFVNLDDEVARFEALGDLPGGDESSQVTALSASGDVVVGVSRASEGDQAVRWTVSTGLVALGGPQSRAAAVSPDGTLISGSVAEPSYEKGRAAALWRAGASFALLGTRPGVPTPEGPVGIYWFVDGTAVLDDGRVFGTCLQLAAYGEPIACRYDGPSTGLSNLSASYVYAADAAGHFAGSANSERHAPFSSWARYDRTTLGYPQDVLCAANAGCLAAARDFSADGALVVGTSSIPPANTPYGAPLMPTAFTYSKSDGARNGMVRLPDLPGGLDASGAYAVSADGRVIVGFGNDERGQQAVVWLDRTPTALEDLLLAQGGVLPDGFTLEEVRASSADGRVLAGNGTNAGGHPEGFRVVLASVP